jgi:Family of unknown function (DUF6655)
VLRPLPDEFFISSGHARWARNSFYRRQLRVKDPRIQILPPTHQERLVGLGASAIIRDPSGRLLRASLGNLNRLTTQRKIQSMRGRWLYVVFLLCFAGVAGCGTTKWSDSPRTATEQLLISDAVDRSISELDFSALANRSVYLDTRFIVTTLDQNYVTSTLRQHMLASGCIIKDKAEEADYIVEVRAGALGTNRNDVLVGVPATNIPTAGFTPTGTAAIPEIALAKTTNQQAVCKIAVFAYDRMSGRPVWQSGNRKVASRAKDRWLLGTGPFQRGSIYEGTAFAGEKLHVPLFQAKRKPGPTSSVGVERHFDMPAVNQLDDRRRVENAGYATPLPPTGGNAASPEAGQPPLDSGASTTPVGPPKAAYTPPPPPPAMPPPTPGLQGNLTQQPISPVTNPASSTAGVIETYNLAKGLLNRD